MNQRNIRFIREDYIY